MVQYLHKNNSRRIGSALDFLEIHLERTYQKIFREDGDLTQNFGTLTYKDDTDKTFSIHPIIDHELPSALSDIIDKEIKNERYSIILPLRLKEQFPEEKTFLDIYKGNDKTAYKEFSAYKNKFSELTRINALRQEANIVINNRIISQYFDYQRQTIAYQILTHIQQKSNDGFFLCKKEYYFDRDINNSAALSIYNIDDDFLGVKTGLLKSDRKNLLEQEKKKKTSITKNDRCEQLRLDFNPF